MKTDEWNRVTNNAKEMVIIRQIDSAQRGGSPSAHNVCPVFK